MQDPLSRSSRLLGPLFLCLSGSAQQQQQQQQQQHPTVDITALPPPPGETLPARQAPVSPSDVSSHKRSEGSAVSQTSSETSFSDSKSDIKSFDDRPTPLWDQQVDNSELPAVPASKDNSSFDRPPQQRPSPRMMHQTSSRLLRMTEDDRPFTRGLQCSEQDFKDLFSTLMVSLPLTSHRVRFTRIEHTFTTEEAITNLGSLKFSQSNRMPDPKDPSRIVTTTTTTTFSMAKEMARSVCMRFLEARFVESVEGKTDFNSRGSVWQLTPKGMHILSRFCQRNGIHQKHVNELLDSPRNMMQLVILERETETDKLVHDEATVQVLFRRFAGDTGPNLKVHSSGSDSDSMSDYATGLIGVRMQKSRRNDKDAPYVFTGKAAYDWLMDCCTTVDKREIFELANSFIANELIAPAGDERQAPAGTAPRFAASKHVLYAITQKGMRIAGWVTSPNGSVHGDGSASRVVPNGVVRDSNTNRMTVIIRDPALRLLFREYLRETHCEENLAFYVEVRSFLAEYERAKRDTSSPRLDIIRETLASAYSLYNAFLAPGSPCELNIDHNLRNALAGRMTRAVGEDEQMLKSLDEVAVLFDQAQSSVFKLMASDSVPKFSREPKYARVLRERNLEGMMNSFASASIS
ncbi:Developmental regulator [Hortaea werneckii]|nr:Developmental regulator [Hortaea werneckii]KAI6860108.1 Developmental regulator [Hortaea werneckii]KAI7347984.1 Developmental regulator [Hortaea werneckii]KAI7628910.1 Developmental regulator [Hortaea werneckii]KAI7716851.1 Developmental regulator [Hortaea werneckii]